LIPAARLGKVLFQSNTSFEAVMDSTTWMLFFLTETILCFSPGPAVLYVLSQSIHAGFRTGAAANLGVASGNTIYFIISATGLSALLLTSQTLFEILKYLGAAYLIYLGIRCFTDRSARLDRMSGGLLVSRGAGLALPNRAQVYMQYGNQICRSH